MPGFYRTIMHKKGTARLLAAWVITGDAAGTKALFARDGDGCALLCRDDAFPAALAAEIGKTAPDQTGIAEYPGARVFLEPIAGARRLVVCGAGHVALCVIRLGVALGFDITAIEDRPEFAEKARDAGAQNVLCQAFTDALDRIDGDADTAFVVMTREHAHDVDCLRRILRKPCAYAGMMGSRGRSAQIRRQLVAEGFGAGRVDALRMPIGVPIGARTPEEIAVSVAAELISAMNAADPGEGWPQGMLEALCAPHEPGVLAMIVEKRGEAPRRPGTKMLVMGDGRFVGTVGGGYAEAEILRLAGEMLRDGDKACRLMSIDMNKGPTFCGGEIEVFLLPV